jgi:uracil-DNA glycosylase family 4
MCALGKKRQHARGREIDPHVFSTMTPSRVMVVGQNPGFNECLEGEPFVGAAGETFNKEIGKHGLDRSMFYITNAVKCFTPDNRTPNPDEIEACEPFLRMEIATVDPHWIVTLGAPSFRMLCPEAEYGPSLGTLVESKKFSRWVMPIYHPSPRNLSSPDRLSRFQIDIKRMCDLLKATGHA